MSTREDEFTEFETDEATFDAMMARGEPAEIVTGPLADSEADIQSTSSALALNGGEGLR